MLGNVVNTNTDGNPNFFIALGYHLLGVYIISPFALGIVDFFTALGFLYARHYDKTMPMPNQRKNWELERWGASMLLLGP